MRAVGLSATSFPTLEEAFKKWLAKLDPTAEELKAAYGEGCLAAADENLRQHDNPYPLGPLADAWRKGYRDAENTDAVPDDEGK